MAPFRPTNVNKRAYPGNAGVIGPTLCASLGISTTTCNTCVSTLCGTKGSEEFTLGCRCTTFSCPYCHCCCCCSCTVCTQTVPSGRWKRGEQLEAARRGAWGSSVTCVTGPTTGYCTGVLGSCTSVGNDCFGFFICCSGATKWWVAPSSTQAGVDWYSRNSAVSNAGSVGGTGWFIPDISQLQNPGFNCRGRWDSYASSDYWSNSQGPQDGGAWYLNFGSGSSSFSPDHRNKSNARCARAFRTT